MIAEAFTRLVQDYLRDLSEKYREVPFPINQRIEHNNHAYCLTLYLEFEDRSLNEEFHISLYRTRGYREFSSGFFNLNQFVRQIYADFNQREDMSLLSRCCHSIISLGPNGAGSFDFYNSVNIRDRLLEQISRHYGNGTGLRRFFSLRDVNAEEEFYRPQIITTRDAYRDMYMQRTPNMAIYPINRVDPEEMRRLIQSLTEQVQGVLLNRINPDIFLENARRLDSIDREVAYRIRDVEEYCQRPRRRTIPPGRAWEISYEPPTPEELARFRGAERKREEAREKGEKLLKEHLSPSQLKDYEKKKSFKVIGNHTGKTYEITHGVQLNVYELDKRGNRIKGHCFVPIGSLVPGDVMLTQKIELELNEQHALKVSKPF